MLTLNANLPTGPIQDAWTNHKNNLKLVGPKNRPKFKIIVVGTGLAGAAAAASLGAMGYQVDCFCFQDSPRRAHSIAAQGGVNASKNYRNDGDSTWRLFTDTIKGGDYRAREANVYRLAELSTAIIDQAVAQGVPFAREYGGKLANRSFGGVLVERTFYCRGETGQQLLLGCYQALAEQIGKKQVAMYNRSELLDLVVHEGICRGIVARDLESGQIKSFTADAVVLATGGYGNVYHLSTNAKGCNVTAAYRAFKRGAGFANPCFTQIHPTSIPNAGDYQSKLTLMSESLRNDGRIWVPRNPGDKRLPADIPEADRFYYLEERYPAFGNLVPRDVAARNAKEVCDRGIGVGPTGYGVYLDFADAIKRNGVHAVKSKYANLFEMYHRITDEDPIKTPMRIYPAVHYTMGGLWVDYNLMTTLPGLFAIGEANFADHGANRLGASSLMQCLADGYFILPVTIGDYLAKYGLQHRLKSTEPVFQETEKEAASRVQRLLSIKGKRTVSDFHRELGKIMWNDCGISRSQSSLEHGLQAIPQLREEFYRHVNVPGSHDHLNQSLEHAGRVADFLEFGELMCQDALLRDESCGCHFREEHQTEDNEAKRNDDEYTFVSVFEYKGEGAKPELHKEPLEFKAFPLAQRNYK
ncbi:MAG TPA: fumarate reductase/succinate dehydrogenase flavoprotein subunit [Pirellulaceae bacterium]|nr:fumarate reductase/succinate dehydrogenase flavoprotein subunit [Pirellulaceae bacterium]HMO93749.1 fumarate reductase/succinate dehydrogenase flavoprotein subunit [Pirellulaceae bacterium]HMP69914.1 fumarate reductase/succinate dehydrogenase flavoprotein subunit [Pirellulaceae bacterium]